MILYDRSMRITKCDSCKKVIKQGDEVIMAGLGLWKQAELCRTCGAPVREFLKRHNFIREEGTPPAAGRTTRTKR